MNHEQFAMSEHEKTHPPLEDIADMADFLQIDLLWGSPDCVLFSPYRARGTSPERQSKLARRILRYAR